MRNRYDLMDSMTDDDGTVYPDCLSIPIEKFRYRVNGQAVRLSQVDIDRFDIFIYNTYKSLHYIDIILWLNNIGSIRELEAGVSLSLPAKSDLDAFYIKYRTS
jgi:hypothetical protein